MSISYIGFHDIPEYGVVLFLLTRAQKSVFLPHGKDTQFVNKSCPLNCDIFFVLNKMLTNTVVNVVFTATLTVDLM